MDEEQIRQALIAFPGSRRAADGIILRCEDDGFFYITDIGKADPDLAPGEDFYCQFCAKKEIMRLREIKSSHDYLLRFRANAIADSPRLSRVMSARRKRFEAGGRVWSLSAYYDTLNGPTKRYLARIPRRERKIARSFPSGFAPLAAANAVCLKSLVGEVIIVSEALRYFYYFMTICIHGGDYGIRFADRRNAGLIGLRVMLGSEAQDFDIDPRGILPPRAEATIRQHVDAMIEFTFAHEYAHLLLNHLSSVGPTTAAVQDVDHKTYSHAQEYEADLHAITIVGRNDRVTVAHAAYNVFLYLHLIELISFDHSDVPSFSVSATHPTPLDRLRRLREALGDRDQPERYRLGLAVRAVREVRDMLLEGIRSSSQAHLLTSYGSIYMHGLGGKEREDRIDY